MESFREDRSKNMRDRQCNTLSDAGLIALSTNHGGPHDSERPEADFLDVSLQFAFYSWVGKRRFGGGTYGRDECTIPRTMMERLLCKRERQIVINQTKGFFRSRLLAGCARCTDYGVGPPVCHLRQKFLQLWGHRVHQSILRWQWFPSWRYDLGDHLSCEDLGQRISSYQSRRSENQNFHGGSGEGQRVRQARGLSSQTTLPAPCSFRR